MAFAYYVSGQGTQLVSYIRAQLQSGGWSPSGSALPITFTKTYSGKVLDFTWQELTASYLRFTMGGYDYFIHTGATDLNGYYFYTVAAIDDLCYVGVTGPQNGQTGAKDATYGSNSGFFAIVPYEPYWTADSTTANHFVVMSSSQDNAGSSTHFGRIRKAFGGADWVQCEFATVRPAVQDVDTVGDLIPGIYQQGQVVYWDFIVVETNYGIRGRLKHLYMAGDNYYQQLSGDNLNADQKHSAYPDVVVDGYPHYLIRPFFQPNGVTTQHSPLGAPDKTFTVVSNSSRGGPNIIVRTA